MLATYDRINMLPMSSKEEVDNLLIHTEICLGLPSQCPSKEGNDFHIRVSTRLPLLHVHQDTLPSLSNGLKLYMYKSNFLIL